MRSREWLTTADVLDGPIRGAVVVGGGGREPGEVRGVAVWELSDLDSLRAEPGDVVLVAMRSVAGQWSPAVEVLLRRAAGRGAAMVVLTGEPATLPLSTGRLADRLHLFTVQAPAALGPVEIATRIRLAVEGLLRTDTDTLVSLAEELARAGDLDTVHAALKSALRGKVIIDLGERGRLGEGAQPTGDTGATSVAVTRTLPGGLGEIVVTRATRSGRWERLADQALALAVGTVVALDGQQRLAEARHRHVVDRVMSEILQGPANLSHGLAAQASRLGLATDGWHVGLDVLLRGEAPIGPVLDLLRQRVQELGAVTPWLRRGAGYVAWYSTVAAPTASSQRRLTAVLEGGVVQCRRHWPGLEVTVGVGSAAREAEGIARSVEQATQAGLVAASSPGEGAVRVVHDLGSSRLLLGWYGSGVFRDVADDILQPLVALGDSEILRTLAAYLDRACSASHTARALQVHRNTVNQRIARAERALGVSLTDADARLALQLALRAHRERPGN